MNERKKTLLVGLDAACWAYINPLLNKTRLPALKKLMDAGAWGTLQSTMPAWTPTAWSTLITGKNPGKHGIYDMTTRQPGSYQTIPTNDKLRHGTPFWRRLNEAGLKVGLVNIPFTYPPQSLEGFLVCGFGTPGSAQDITYPANIMTWIKSELGVFEPVVDPDLLLNGKPEQIFEAEQKLQTSQTNIAAQLADQYQVDVLVINLMLPDHANHKMPKLEQVERAICQSDADLQYLIDAFAPDNVMVISDHGSSRVKGNFLLQAWLRDNGYYVQTKRPKTERKTALNWILYQWLHMIQGKSGIVEKGLRHLYLATIPHLPANITQKWWEKVDQAIPFAREHVDYTNQPDFERTKVFPGTIHSGLLYLNMAGREPTGVVSPHEKDLLITELTNKLGALSDPETGQLLFPNIYTADQIYTGAATRLAPDLILDTYQTSWNIQLSSHDAIVDQARERYFVSGRDYGYHSRDGIYVFSGPAFQSNGKAKQSDLVDIPATLLYLHGVPIPEDYDGRVLTHLFTTEFRNKSKPLSQPGDTETDIETKNPYTQQEADELFDHLRALGYVE
ncbi:MAG: hypothetical protein GY796_01530 [Chloroflexi bacterium]|nr:hypothetical protein [Chloroflexota bacterium]